MSDADRELLELASKAAGYKVLPHLSASGEWVSGQSEMYLVSESGHPLRKWNPLTDDGDSILLATKLCSEGKMRVQISEQYVACHFLQDGVFVPHAWDYDGIQPQEAFRKCVTHTAAEIGRNMK